VRLRRGGAAATLLCCDCAAATQLGCDLAARRPGSAVATRLAVTGLRGGDTAAREPCAAAPGWIGSLKWLHARTATSRIMNADKTAPGTFHKCLLGFDASCHLDLTKGSKRSTQFSFASFCSVLMSARMVLFTLFYPTHASDIGE
jgi:hypothetical protein